MKLTTKQQALLTYIRDGVKNAEIYNQNRGVLIATKKEDQFGNPIRGEYYTPRIVRALFELGLVENVWGNAQNPVTEYRKKERQHILIPRGFQHPTFGWKVGDIGRQTFTCGSLVQEHCYGVVVKVEKGVLTLRPLNFHGSENWNAWACNATKHTLEEALGHIAQQVAEIPKKDHFLRYLERGY